MQITFTVVSDLYSAGRTDDGTDYHAEVYFVQAEREDGIRWSHPAAFYGAKRHTDEDGWSCFEDVRESAKAQADSLLLQVQRYHATHGIDFDKWHPAPTAYGSAAYGLMDEFDRMDEEEVGRFLFG